MNATPVYRARWRGVAPAPPLGSITVVVRLLCGCCVVVVWLLFGCCIGFEWILFDAGLVLGNATQLRVNHPECARVLAMHRGVGGVLGPFTCGFRAGVDGERVGGLGGGRGSGG